MPTQQLPASLELIFTAYLDPDAIFAALLPALCEVLDCDRCFFYFRNPHTHEGTITHCYRRDPKWDDLTSPDWKPEGNIIDIDPLFAIAFKTPESVYVDDIETAGPEVVNLEFEQQDYKHRALIHTPIYHDGLMYGILEPCVFDHPRVWTESDRQIIDLLQEKLGPLAVDYLHSLNKL